MYTKENDVYGKSKRPLREIVSGGPGILLKCSARVETDVTYNKPSVMRRIFDQIPGSLQSDAFVEDAESD